MLDSFSNWFQRKFVGTELGALTLFLVFIILAFWWLSSLILPVLISIALAYLFSGVVKKLIQWQVPQNIAVYLVYLFFLSLLIFSLFILLPLLWDQLSLLFNELPTKLKQAEGYFTELSQRYPAYISKAQIQNWVTTFQADFSQLGKHLLSFSFTTLSKIMTAVVYLILVPLMVYFFMKDKDAILAWLARLLPEKRQLMREVWVEIDQQMGHYISSKVLEVVIVGIVTTIAFLLLGLNYAILLAVLVGVSAIIPYVGVILVTLPVVAVGYMQWGFDIHFLYLMIVYVALMILDGNILTPLLFSETMNLHPVAVIIAILIFGGLWGFWGIFFAIPLASVTKILVNAWLKHSRT
jgi:putative permease